MTKYERAIQRAQRARGGELAVTLAICLVPVVMGVLATLQVIGVVS